MPTDNATLQLILDELKGARHQIDMLVRDVANLKAVEGEHSRNMQKFWAENWGPLKADITDIKNRLSKLEQRDVQELERRLDKVESDAKLLTEAKLTDRVSELEKSDAKKHGIAAAAGMLGGGGIAALFRWLLEGGN